MDRRSFIFGAGAAIVTAPAIVRVSSLMKIKVYADTFSIMGDGVSLISISHPYDESFKIMKEIQDRIVASMLHDYSIMKEEWDSNSIVWAKEGLRIASLKPNSPFANWKE